MSEIQQPLPMLPTLPRPSQPNAPEDLTAMKRDRAEWENEGGGLYPHTDINRAETATSGVRQQFDPSLSGTWTQRAVPFALTAAAIGALLAIAFI